MIARIQCRRRHDTEKICTNAVRGTSETAHHGHDISRKIVFDFKKNLERWFVPRFLQATKGPTYFRF